MLSTGVLRYNFKLNILYNTKVRIARNHSKAFYCKTLNNVSNIEKSKTLIARRIMNSMNLFAVFDKIANFIFF